MKLIARDIPPRSVWALEQAGVHPLLAQLYAARGVQTPLELDDALAHLLPPADLMGSGAAATLLADAIAADLRLCIVADYDCDGATACAVAVRGLRLLGARHVHYLVPDRVVDGYGLAPPIAERVKASGADVLITVDNGIGSIDGVATARALGLQVLVTDHHLPAVLNGQTLLPAADVIVNPNQPGCNFASKAIAGVGVMFYVLLALRAELRQRGRFADGPQPKLDSLLPLVALGTVADVVRLDAATLTRRTETDGPLKPEYRRTELVDLLQREVWGQGFAAPTFSEELEVLSQRLVGEKHLALKLKHQGQPVDGIWFGRTEPLPARAKLAFRLDADAWNGVRRVRFLIEAAEA